MDLHNFKSEEIKPISREECENLMRKANLDLSCAESLNSNPIKLYDQKSIIDSYDDIKFIKQAIKEENERDNYVNE